MHIQVLLEIVETSRIEHSIVIIKVENIEFEEKIRLSKKKTYFEFASGKHEM